MGDPNVSSTTGLDSKKKLDINKDIKTIKKELDSLTSFKDKKELGEELFAPTATIIQQVKPKLNKIEKRPSISSKFDIFGSPFNDLRTKDKIAKDKLASKDKKDKLKAKQRFQTNDLKDFLAADNKSTVKKTIRTSPEKKPEIKKDEKVDTKRRLSTNAENDDLEPRTKIPKLKPDSDTEPEAKKVKSTEAIKPMGRIPKIEKIEKIEKKERERTDSVKSQENFNEREKDKNKPQVKPPKSKHHDREK